MPAEKYSEDDLIRLAGSFPTKSAMAIGLGLNKRALQRRIKRIEDRKGIRVIPGEQFEIEDDCHELRPVEDLIAERKLKFQNKRKYEDYNKLINVRVNIDGPIGILHFGDPHVDDDGTDIGLLESHVKLVRDTDGLFGANVGDTTNNWTGRLGRLYSQQSTSAQEAWQLAEWFLTQIPWLYVIGGNHDCWSGAGDPLRWILEHAGSIYKSSEVRLGLKFPNGNQVRINAHHDFSGSSQWNPAHGPMKAAQFGFRDHILVNGHKHISGYGILKCPSTGTISHCVQVSSYKVYDRFAREKGFRDQSISPCALTVIDPSLDGNHPDAVKVFWQPECGAEYLKWLRSKR